ncbi:MAG: N-6 DNA methylase [Defluviitaleaceae bacterium]|nr:N-6 DNA methylase [Defluviitaleaceae bacterium]
MAKKEANFDLYIHGLLKDAKINATAQGSSVPEISEALKTASKRQTGGVGYPEFIAVVKDFVLVMEDKPDRNLLCLKDSIGNISLTVDATEKYAINGALFYAQKIVEHTAFKKVFAFGNAGDSKHHILQPLFVGADGYIELSEVETFENFSENNISEYYKRTVLGEIPSADIELGDILKKAKDLHEYLRNYGSLGEDEKPLVVSAILLALREQSHGFSLDQLIGDTLEGATDGAKIYEQLENSLKRAKVKPEVKKEQVLNQFTLIKDRPKLNAIHDTLQKTPLKYFAEYINTHIYKAVVSASPEDYLGRFYGEFVSYSGGDGQSLGVVLTPSHITNLFCDLVDLKSDDIIFDPCCGTGGFLVAGMYKMLSTAKTESEKKRIREKQIHGIEARDDMFTIATTNMILRGDGRSNLTCGDFFDIDPADTQLSGVTVGFMNPPYSQAKDKNTAYLSELSFIRQLLNSITAGGRVAVIVPVSILIGKTKEDEATKKELLKNHTLEGVVSLNKNTFYRIGTVPCAAIFTTGEPHPKDKLVKFINFEDDGYEVKKHLGLVETERAKDRKSYLLDCWRGKIDDAPSKFMVQTTIEDTDEWIHSFYYYNDEAPTEDEIISSIADYMTFEFSMVAHGKSYLFDTNLASAKKNKEDSCIKNLTPLSQKVWLPFYFNKVFTQIKRGKRLKKADHHAGTQPYISSSAVNNGVDGFISNSDRVRKFSNCLTVANSGSVGKAFYHEYEFIASDHVTQLKNPEFNQHTYLFLAPIVSRLSEKYSFNREINDKRINKEILLLPVDENENLDWKYMEQYALAIIQQKFGRYLDYKGISPDKILGK